MSDEKVELGAVDKHLLLRNMETVYDTWPDDWLGAGYRAPAKWPKPWAEVEVARFEKEVDENGKGDGFECVLFETRTPARFYRLVVLPGENSCDEPQDGWQLSTGSGIEVGKLLYRIGEQVAGGMIGYAPIAAEDIEEAINE